MQPDVERLKPILAAVAVGLSAAVERWPGTLLEEKGLSLTIHYRQCPEAKPDIERMLAKVHERIGPRIKLVPGKEAIEIQPSVDWDKGHAAATLLDRWNVGDAAFFMGDDRIDEPAFVEIRKRGGITCRIADEHAETAAEWLLPSPDDGRALLALLIEALR